MSAAKTAAALGTLILSGARILTREPFWASCALILLAGELFGTPVTALPPYAEHMHSTLQQTGVAGLLVLGCYHTLVAALSIERIDSTNARVRALIRHSVLLGVALSSITLLAPLIETVITESIHSPGRALAAMLSGVTLALIFRQPKPSAQVNAPAAISGHFASSFVRQMTDDERHKVAVHEAGHLLLFGLLNEPPKDLNVHVRQTSASGGIRGQVRLNLDFDVLTTETRLRWLMWMLLAGMEAQFVVFGERSDGADTDMREWHQAALRYLASGFGEDVLCAPPGAESDEAKNLLALRVLKRECQREVQEVLTRNRAVLDELTTCALKGASREELAPILARVEGARIKVGALAVMRECGV